jgi:hypothetical protein
MSSSWLAAVQVVTLMVQLRALLQAAAVLGVLFTKLVLL